MLTYDLNTFVRPPFASVFSETPLNLPLRAILQEQIPTGVKFWFSFFSVTIGYYGNYVYQPKMNITSNPLKQ